MQMKRLRNPSLCPVSAFIDSADQIIFVLKGVTVCILKKEFKFLVTYQYCQLSEISFVYINNLIPEITVLLMLVLFNRSESRQISTSG